MDESLQKSLVDVIQFLQTQRVPYAVIGGLAASLHGEPRVTADIDLVIGVTTAGAIDLIPRLGGSSLEPLFTGVEEVVERAFILPLRHRATGVKVDLAIGLSGFEQQALSRAEKIRIEGHDVAVATAEDLLIMKLLAGRPRDQQDIEGIISAQGERLDWDYCLETAQALGKAIDQDIVSQVRKLRLDFGNAN